MILLKKLKNRWDNLSSASKDALKLNGGRQLWLAGGLVLAGWAFVTIGATAVAAAILFGSIGAAVELGIAITDGSRMRTAARELRSCAEEPDTSWKNNAGQTISSSVATRKFLQSIENDKNYPPKAVKTENGDYKAIRYIPADRMKAFYAAARDTTVTHDDKGSTVYRPNPEIAPLPPSPHK